MAGIAVAAAAVLFLGTLAAALMLRRRSRRRSSAIKPVEISSKQPAPIQPVRQPPLGELPAERCVHEMMALDQQYIELPASGAEPTVPEMSAENYKSRF